MADNVPTLTEDEQRRFQAQFWGLPPCATWDQIRKDARKSEKAPIYYHPDDWEETMIRMYGIVFSSP